MAVYVLPTRYLKWGVLHILSLVALAISITSCGGGGGGSGSGGGGVSASTYNISATAATNEGAPVLPDPVTFTVSATGTYYYELSWVGTAVGGGSIAVNGVTSITYNTGNPTITSPSALGYAIGGTIYGTWSGEFGINTLALLDPALLGAGVYRDSITLRICSDAACTQQIGSLQTVSITYTITGAPPAAGALVQPTTAQIELPSSQTSAGSGSFSITGSSIPPTGAYVKLGPSVAGLVTNAQFTGTLATAVSPGQNTINFLLKPPATVGVGIHADSFPISVCYDVACTRPLADSPLTASLTYIVDPTPGIDYQQNSIGVTVAGMVWDAQTQKLYAIAPSYSALDPNTLVQINPVAATVEAVISLDNGSGIPEIDTLAVSDDGQYLYLAVTDASRITDHVERIRTSDRGLDLTISLPSGNLVAQLQPAPASPHVLAVSLAEPSAELLIYDDAVARANTLSPGAFTQMNSIAWGSNASTLYADIFTTGVLTTSIDTLSVAASGVSVSNSPSLSYISGSMHFVGGLLYFDDGSVFDPVAGAFTDGFVPAGGMASDAAFDSSLDRAYFVTNYQPQGSASQRTTIEGFQLSTRRALWVLPFISQNPASYLTRWGSNGLAFFDNAGAGSLVLLSGTVVTQ